MLEFSAVATSTFRGREIVLFTFRPVARWGRYFMNKNEKREFRLGNRFPFPLSKSQQTTMPVEYTAHIRSGA